MKLTILSTTLTFALAYGQGSLDGWAAAGPGDCMLIENIQPSSITY